MSEFLRAEWYSTVCIYHVLLIHLSVYGYLGCFHILAIINNDALNMGIHISLWDLAFHSLEYIPRSEIALSYGNYIFSFFFFFFKWKCLFLWKHCFWQCCTIWHSHQPGILFYHIFANTRYFFVFLMLAILMGVR